MFLVSPPKLEGSFKLHVLMRVPNFRGLLKVFKTPLTCLNEGPLK